MSRSSPDTIAPDVVDQGAPGRSGTPANDEIPPQSSILRAPRSRLEGIVVALALAAGYLLLVVVWTATNPPFAGPDESQHYAKAVALGHGDVRGVPVALPPGLPAATIPWYTQVDRGYAVAAGFEPTGRDCFAFHPNVTAACAADVGPAVTGTVVVDQFGAYNPAPYLPAAAVARWGSGAVDALMLGRAASTLVSAALLVSTLLVLRDRHRRGGPWAGVALAITPMIVFLTGELGPNGIEATAGLCVCACALRLARPGGASTKIWVLTAVAGAVLMTTRSLGPLWVGVDIVLLAMLRGPAPTVRWLLQQRRRAAVVAGGILAGAITAEGWWFVFPRPHSDASVGVVISGIPAGLRLIGNLLREQVGTFGWLDTPMPGWAYASWAVAVAVLVVAAFAVGTKRQRIVLALVVAGLWLGSGIVDSVLAHTLGLPAEGVEGRYLLPATVVVPLLAGEILWQRHARAPRLVAGVTAVAVATAVLVHTAAWYTNSRRYAVGIGGPVNFIKHAAWAPALGWQPWLALLLAALVGLGIAGILACRDLLTTERGSPPLQLQSPTGMRR